MFEMNREQALNHLASLQGNDAMQSALSFIENDHFNIVDEQCRLALVEAPSFKEAKRAEALCSAFRGLGLTEVGIDSAGNAIGKLKGSGARGTLLVEAHLDTVFPFGTAKSVTKKGDRIEIPGICDNCRGLAAMLGIIKAFRSSGVCFCHDILFAGTSCEEGLGDLRGMKELFKGNGHDIFASISIDGCGGDFVFDGTGSRRYSVVFKVSGGHSWTDFGSPSAVHALGRAIAMISGIIVPEEPKTTFNVGVISGGTSVNSIAQKAEMLVDMRSVSPEELDKLEASFKKAVNGACMEETDGSRTKEEVRVTFGKVGDRPGGLQGNTSGMKMLAELSSVLLGLEFEDSGPSSTNANIPVSLGIPCLCMGGGGDGGAIHTVEEWFEPEEGWKHIQKAALIIAALAALAD